MTVVSKTTLFLSLPLYFVLPYAFPRTQEAIVPYSLVLTGLLIHFPGPLPLSQDKQNLSYRTLLPLAVQPWYLLRKQADQGYLRSQLFTTWCRRS